jgi:cytochrome c biogenesis protein ResB
VLEFLASTRLALALLISILFVCLAGVIFLPHPANKEIVFSSWWFNSLLGLLMLNLVCCFFRRIVRRKATLVSFGLIVFHLSLVSLCAGVIYDHLFFSMEH